MEWYWNSLLIASLLAFASDICTYTPAACKTFVIHSEHFEIAVCLWYYGICGKKKWSEEFLILENCAWNSIGYKDSYQDPLIFP